MQFNIFFFWVNRSSNGTIKETYPMLGVFKKPVRGGSNRKEFVLFGSILIRKYFDQFLRIMIQIELSCFYTLNSLKTTGRTVYF